MDKEFTQQLIKDFLKETFGKEIRLIPKSRVHVYECVNADGLSYTDFFKEAACLLELYAKGLIPPEEEANFLKKFQGQSRCVFVGRNYIAIAEDRLSAISRLQSINIKRDSSMFEVVEYKRHYIAYD